MQEYGNTTATETPRDSEMAEQAHKTLAEAAERVTFHRVECERWERIGRAAQASLNHLQSTVPMEKMTPDGFLGQEPMSAPMVKNY